MNFRTVDVQTANIQPQKQPVNNTKEGNNNPVAQPQVSSDDKKGSQALSSYFRGSQLVAFKGFSCSKSDFIVKKEEGIPCACCGRLMMTNKGVENFERNANGATGEYLQKLLKANMEYFRGTEKAVANFILETSEKNPKLSMSGLMSYYSPNAKVLLENEQKNVLGEVSKKAEVLGKDNAVQKVVDQALKDIDNSTDKKHFERIPFLETFAKTVDKIEDKKLAGELLDTAVKLPMSQSSIEAFIVKYGHGDKSDKQIARRLAQPAIATAEHIHPDTLGGPDNTANYMSECGDCNSKRGHMPYSEWMKNYPNMPRSIQRNIDEVTERIINGNLGDKYDDYPVDLQKAVDKETEGVVKLTVKNPEEIEKAREERGLPKPEPYKKKK